MARDSSLAVRRAALKLLKGHADLTALIPAVRIYPATVLANPTWPFAMVETRIGRPIRASGIDGLDLPISVSCYAKPRTNESGAVIETAEDFAFRAGAEVANALDLKAAILDTSYEARCVFRWLNTQAISVGDEADARRALVNFRARVIS